MINFKNVKNYCNESLSLIENYDKAFADKEQTWDCHHRRELETSRKELIKIGEYFNRPASELIFLTKSEHNAIHKTGNKNNLGKHLSEEHKKKLSDALKGKPLTEETKRKLSEAHKGKRTMLGKHHSEETKRKMSEAMKYKNIGRCWFNNGIKSVFVKECPEGFVRGMLKRKKHEEK